MIYIYDDTETGRAVVKCDCCGIQEEYPTDIRFLAYMKAQSRGWIINENFNPYSFEDIDEWYISCPDCGGCS